MKPLPEPFEGEPDEGNDVAHLFGVENLNEHTCKWPVGDPLEPGFGFCGQHSEPGKPYCAEHCERAVYRTE